MTDKARILIVEDESIIALDIRDRLEGLGYAIADAVSSGAEAVQAAAETRPSVVLMDIRLKGSMDGVQAAEQIRARFDIPVVYLTAYSDETTLQRAKVTEPFGYLLKPFEDRELHIAIAVTLYKHEMERKLKQRERWLAATLSSIGDAVIATDAQGRIELMNPAAEALTGWRQRQASGEYWTKVFNILHETPPPLGHDPASQALPQDTTSGQTRHILITKDGREVPIGDSASPIKDEKGTITGAVLIFRDVSQEVQAQQAREELIAELQEALDKVKTLSGLLPICSSCKKIRDDQGYWQQVEVYIQDHSDAEFSHGICPDCARKLYPDLFDRIYPDDEAGAGGPAGTAR
jgi:PAS domain S-box-containing protein